MYSCHVWQAMRLFVILALLPVQLWAGGVPFFNGNLEQLRQSAHKRGMPYLLYFQTQGSKPCQAMGLTLEDPALGAFAARHYLALSFNAALNASGHAIAQEHNVHAVPAILVFGPEGQYWERISGYRDTETLRQILQRLLDEHAAELVPARQAPLPLAPVAVKPPLLHPPASRSLPVPEVLQAPVLAVLPSAENPNKTLELPRTLESPTQAPVELAALRSLDPGTELSETPGQAHTDVPPMPEAQAYRLSRISQSRSAGAAPAGGKAYGVLYDEYDSMDASEAQCAFFAKVWKEDIWLYSRPTQNGLRYQVILGAFESYETAEAYQSVIQAIDKKPVLVVEMDLIQM